MRGSRFIFPLEEARTLIILTILFVLGRVLFWVGYPINPYVRAFGFGLTFYPTVVVYAWLILAMVFGIQVPALTGLLCPLAAIGSARGFKRRPFLVISQGGQSN